MANGSAWNSSKALLNKDTVKDKAYLFKSQKYIRDFKGTSIIGNDSSIIVKKEEQKWVIKEMDFGKFQ
mgnify:CR=1 FL=1